MWGPLWTLARRFWRQALDWAKRNSKKLYNALKDGYNATVEYCKQNPDVCRRLLRFLIGIS